jgi:ABC-type transport system involved in cytochrome bd biosynthesis fused ATPase/permease subunit
MKKRLLTMAIITFMAVIISPSYGQEPDKKSVKARENLKEEQKDVVEAKRDLKEAQKDSISEYQKFKRKSEMKIRDTNKHPLLELFIPF